MAAMSVRESELLKKLGESMDRNVELRKRITLLENKLERLVGENAMLKRELNEGTNNCFF
jgi:hypothetical protein